jgi:hypothetical protein
VICRYDSLLAQLILAISLFWFLAAPAMEQSDKPVSTNGFILPPGFTITEVAGPDLANDIY